MQPVLGMQKRTLWTELSQAERLSRLARGTVLSLGGVEPASLLPLRPTYRDQEIFQSAAVQQNPVSFDTAPAVGVARTSAVDRGSSAASRWGNPCSVSVPSAARADPAPFRSEAP